MPDLSDLPARIEALEAALGRIDRQSRCEHTWEPKREDARVWVCIRCGCEDLRRH